MTPDIPTNCRNIDILLVEDNDDDVVIVREALASARLLNLVSVVRNGVEALQYLRGEPPFETARLPGLVLLDINMPLMNGLETLSEIKSAPRLRHLPVVMLTVSGADEDVVASYAAGACSYVRKPVDFDKLRRVVEGFELYWTLVSRVPGPDV